MVDPDSPLPPELREAWSELAPPQLPDDWRDSDPETRAVVAWMRDAWAELEVPPAVLPREIPRAPRRHWSRVAMRVAAILVVGLGVLLGTRGWRDAQHDAGKPGTPTASFPERTEQPRIAALDPGRVEMESGPVRLILLTGD